MNLSITVLLVDDHALLRDTVAGYLAKQPDIVVVGQVGTAHEAVAEVVRLAPDVVLMDIDMPGQSSFEAVKTMRSRNPDQKILFLSGFFNDHYIDQALQVQAMGYLTKNEPPEILIRAVRDVAHGGLYYSPEVLSRMVVDGHGARLSIDNRSRIQLLSPREIEVLRYVARGLAKKEIASAMHISVKTVENHSNSLMSKLDIHDRVKLARFAIREGLIEP